MATHCVPGTVLKCWWRSPSPGCVPLGADQQGNPADISNPLIHSCPGVEVTDLTKLGDRRKNLLELVPSGFSCRSACHKKGVPWWAPHHAGNRMEQLGPCRGGLWLSGSAWHWVGLIQGNGGKCTLSPIYHISLTKNVQFTC